MEENKNKQELKKERKENRKSSKKTKKIILWIIVLSIVGYGIFWIVALPKIPQSELISTTGVHWHTSMSIIIKGETIDIPAGIGIGAVHSPTHTHETDGTIHIEYGGIVREGDIRVGKFFEVWGKDFSKDSILGNLSGENGIVKMNVNGVENFEFENYKMKDGDIIEIVFE